MVLLGTYGITNDMNDRFKTDFLCASSSLMVGLGSVISIDGNLYHYNESVNPDDVAISNDWKMVGQDIKDALEVAETDHERFEAAA